MIGEKIVYVKYLPLTSDDSITAQLVDCYRDVFSDKPWHEWLKCPKCQKYWGIKDQGFLAKQKFLHCDVPLVDFWPREKVVADIFHEINEKSSCWLALAENRVVGFCWGYPIDIFSLEKKVGIGFNDELKIRLGKHETVAYQDEVGVLTSYRGRKVAKTMVAHRLNDFISQGLQVGIVRTRQYPEPSETFLWYRRIGYTILASYPEDDGRVILGRKFDDLSQLL